MNGDVSVTELTDVDLPMVLRLSADSLDLPEDAAEAEAIINRLWEATGVRQTFGLVARVEGEAVGVLLASVATRRSGSSEEGGAATEQHFGHIDFIAVRPAHRRRGIGTALLRRAETELIGLGAAEVRLAGNPPYYAWPGIDVRYTPAHCMALALGYQSQHTAWNMTVDLTNLNEPIDPTPDALARLAESGITVRRATPADAAGLTAFVAREFGDVWLTEVAHSIGRPQAGCHLAVRGDGEILGFAAYGSSRPSWFGPMGTSAVARGLGIGAVLLRRCLADQLAAGHARSQIGWVGPVGFYANAVGARVERVFTLYRRQL
jgi:mycothiol synthase